MKNAIDKNLLYIPKSNFKINNIYFMANMQVNVFIAYKFFYYFCNLSHLNI